MQTLSIASRYMTLGAMPFVALALLVWVAPHEYSGLMHSTFVIYSAAIYSFMGGTLWGSRITQPQSSNQTSEKPSDQALTWGIAASLLAIAAALVGGPIGVGVLLLSYIALPSFERICEMPYSTGYSELRQKINRTVVVSHLVIFVHMIQPHM